MQSDPIQSSTRRGQIDRIGYPLLPLVLLLFYIPTLARGVNFSDGGEIAAAVVSLGVIHPTGYPIFTIIAHIFTRLLPLPIEPCIKIELLNALFASAAAFLCAKALRALIVHGRPSPNPDASAAGLASGFLLGISPLLWRQVRVPEVYPLHLLLVALAAYLIVLFENTRNIKYIVFSAIPLGMGLAHHVTIVYFLPALLIYLLLRRPSFFITWAFPLACLLGALPLCSYAYLIWANKHTTSVPWGGVHDFNTLYNHATGAQYRHFVGTGTPAAFLKRFIQLHAHFDRQFIAIGTLFFFIGIPAFVRRLPRFSLFLIPYFLFNILHGIFYSVGDYANYFLPSVYCSSLFIGFGLYWLLGRIRNKTTERRTWLIFLISSIIVLISSPILYFYAAHLHRVPELAGPGSGTLIAKFMLALGLLALGGTFVFRHYKKSHRIASTLAADTLKPLFFGAYGLIALARVQEIGGEALNGQGFGEEVSANIPPGSILLTQGDGHLFTMWYFQHALGKSTHTSVIDVSNITTPWYSGYLRSRFPADCDPLLPKNRDNPIEWIARCNRFEQRLQIAPPSWIKIDFNGVRTGIWTMRPKALDAGLPRGTDPKCSDDAFRNAHAALCLCWYFPSRAFVSDEECVQSPEEGGIVPRSYTEVQIHRLIEDHIDERPVFERNAITFWENNIELNPRHWQGPSYQRLSGEYAIINRGRVNQIVYQADIRSHKACSPKGYSPLWLRPLRPPRPRTVEPKRRRTYRGTPYPLVLSATYLSPSEQKNEDLGTRDFQIGQGVHLHLQSFERFYFDPKAADKRGPPIRQGLRFCVYNPQGEQVSLVDLVSEIDTSKTLLDASSQKTPGVYHLQACSTGELGKDATLADAARPCERSLAEYDFTIRIP